MTDGDGWRTGWVRCLICSHEWISVYPDGADPKTLECPACGRQTSEAFSQKRAVGREAADLGSLRERREGNYVERMRCLVCFAEWVASYPTGIDTDELMCPYCGAKNSELVCAYRSHEIERVVDEIERDDICLVEYSLEDADDSGEE